MNTVNAVPTAVPAQAVGHSAFPFLCLPPEIRLHIYAVLFKLSTPVYPQAKGLPEDKKARSGFPNGLVLGMVCTNKTLSKEVTHFIYSNNSFYLTLAYHRDWIAQIGQKNSSALHEVILVGGGRPKVAAKQLSAMTASL